MVYTGTHDNDTTRGWYESLPQNERQFSAGSLKRRHDPHDIGWDLIRLAWASVADLALAPLQDVLNLGSKARMNLPGRQEGNWQWRCSPDQPVEQSLQGLHEYTWLYNRMRTRK